MLLVVVALWFLVYIPNWGTKISSDQKLSTKSRKSSSVRSRISKNNAYGVSNLGNRNKKILAIRLIFSALLLASLVGIGYGIIASTANLMSLTVSALSLAVFTFAVSVLRSVGKRAQQKTRPSAAELEAQRRRMAYLIRESALVDAKPDELFDERAWSDTALPDSILNRQMGTIATSKLAQVVSFDDAKSAAQDKKLASEELNLILKRRRANN